MHCVNATTGEGICTISGWFETPIVADGYLVDFNNYQGQIYCFGKGKTATTVTAPDIVVPLGSSVVIRGTVTDQSSGDTCLGIPTAGTPAIADASMSQWRALILKSKNLVISIMFF